MDEMDKMDISSKFIMEALKQGWSVSMNKLGELEFVKNHHSMSKQELKDVLMEGYSKKFLHELSKNFGNGTK